jgi:hypothetical protein
MQDVPRDALIASVNRAKQNESQILKIKLLLSMNLITEDDALNTYEGILRETESLQNTATIATEHILEMSPPRLLEPSEQMSLALTELKALAADQQDEPYNRIITREIARVNAEELSPAATAWYSASVGKMDALKQGDPLLCSGNARIASLGPRNMGVSAASVTIDPKFAM